MRTALLAALALACVCSPAVAAGAAEPITWGQVGWVALAGVVVIACAVALFVIGGIIIRMWSH